MEVKLNLSCRVLFFVAIVFIAGLGPPQTSSAADPLNIYVVNYPLKYFTERIGGEHVRVTFPAPPDVDPAYWVPDIDTITDYQKADLIILNGATYAKWTGKTSLPRARLVNTSRKFQDRYITIAGSVTHSHGPGGEHAHGEIAFTTWLDFRLAAKQAEAIGEALVRKAPQHRDAFMKNLASLQDELKAFDSAARTIVGRNPASAIVVSHPVYDYLARAYGMNIKSLHWEPDEFPNQTQWMELEKLLKKHPSEWILWEGPPDQKIVSELKARGIRSTVFEPMGNVPEDGDFMKGMKQNIRNLEEIYK